MLPREADAAEDLDRVAADAGTRRPRTPWPWWRRGGASAGSASSARPARVVRAGPAELERAQHVGAEVLHGLERADRLVELRPLLRVLDRELERTRAAPTPSTTSGDSTRSTTGHAARASASSPRRAASPARRRARPCLLARAVDGLGGGDPHALGTPRRRRTRRARRSRTAETSTMSRPPRRATCTFVPEQPVAPRARAVDACRQLARRAGLEQRERCRRSSRRPGPAAGRRDPRLEPTASTVETAATADDEERARVHDPAHLLEHDAHVDHAHPRAAVLLGHEQADDAQVGQAPPHLVGGAAVVVEHRAHVAQRCPLAEEAAHRVAQRLLLLAELEVHR